jgi:hypothetical protein
MRKDKTIIILLSMFFLILPAALSHAREPERPDIHHAFDATNEAKIMKVSGLSPQQAFERLKGIDFFVNDQLMYKTIFKAYRNRREEGVNLAMSYLTLPKREIINERTVDRSQDLFVAKMILEVFPEKSTHKLVKLYKSGNAATRGNIIQAAGMISRGKPIRDLLINALDDKTFIEEDDAEMDGDFLRVCDVAYNQLVLRYRINNVLRTIDYSKSIDVRDYHISILKSML